MAWGFCVGGEEDVVDIGALDDIGEAAQPARSTVSRAERIMADSI
ncbi:MAG TPA: hypothetical protein VEY69_04475 [Lautropia sp.]|nr:hypothetical protein [Lautropia sp.]